jgi:hypothetical protein
MLPKIAEKIIGITGSIIKSLEKINTLISYFNLKIII